MNEEKNTEVAEREQQVIPKIFGISIEKEDKLDEIAEKIWEDSDSSVEMIQSVLALNVPENEKQYILYLISGRIGALRFMQISKHSLAQFLNALSN